MSYIVVDVESDGPVPGINSMVCFGAVIVEASLSKTFYGQISPISQHYNPSSLKISGFTREQHEAFPSPEITIPEFAEWIKKNSLGHPILISDNNQFDGMYMNYYFHRFYGKNPFGYSSRRIGDLYCGIVKDVHQKWKHLRETPHDHNPVNDAVGNAQAILKLQNMGLNINLK